MGAEEEPAVSFDQWYATAHRQVLAALVTYCGDLKEGADEAFIRAFTKSERVRNMVSPTGWTFVRATPKGTIRSEMVISSAFR
jgi:DNA-directed RNA polymerase specialized sigma24 family protein